MSRLSLEVEYRVLTTTTCELQWFMYFLNDLKFISTKLTIWQSGCYLYRCEPCLSWNNQTLRNRLLHHEGEATS